MNVKEEFEADADAMDSASFDEDLYAALEKLCKVFNLDPDTIKDAWEKFVDISSKFTLEGDKVSWLACSLLASCRRQEARVGEKTVVKTIPISLTLLLRHTNLSLKQFFQSMKHWVFMAKLPVDFSNDVNTAEGNFFICQRVYTQYLSLFTKVFKLPDLDAVRTRKISFTTTSVGVFEFTWLLFLLLKGKFFDCGNDIIECWKIVQCCCNIAFKNAVMLNQRNVLNGDFAGLPMGWSLPGYQVPKEAPCVLDKMVSNFGTLTLADVKYMQDYQVMKVLADLVKTDGLAASREDYSDLFRPAAFEKNYAVLLKMYEQYTLHEWCYDENIFLKETYRQIEAQEIKCSNDMIASTPVNERRVLLPIPETPLTGRQYVGPAQADKAQDSASDNVAKFLDMLAKRPRGMSDNISKTIADLGGESLGERIVDVELALGKRFADAAGADGEAKRALGVKLFYFLMEGILADERRLGKDVKGLLGSEVFATCVFTCAMEIVVDAAKLPHPFPWMLECMQLPSVHLVKIIEIVVRCTNQLPRNIIKHLSYVEETVLESLMWRDESALWRIMKSTSFVIPKFEEIALPGATISVAGVPSTPTMSRALVGAGLTHANAGETFQSPRYCNIRPGQSLLNPNRNQHASNGSAARRNTSLEIIFRKFYVLAGVRMYELCKKLDINKIDTRRKIWTFLEATIRESRKDSTGAEVWLLKNRHLDQLIMCAVYVVCKVSDRSLMFTDIMQAYKLQPQARSEVYRNVYFDKDDAERSGDLIKFYNKIYIGYAKPLVPKICPKNAGGTPESSALSPLPATPNVFGSPRSQVTRNFYVNALESPTSAEFSACHSYYFNRSHSRDLHQINKVIGHSAKRLLTENHADERESNKRFCNRKMQALIEEREGQKMI